MNVYEVWTASHKTNLQKALTVRADTEDQAVRMATAAGKVHKGTTQVQVRKVRDGLDQREEAGLLGTA